MAWMRKILRKTSYKTVFIYSTVPFLKVGLFQGIHCIYIHTHLVPASTYCYSELAFDDLLMHRYCPVGENVNMFSFCQENATCFENPESQCPSEERDSELKRFTHLYRTHNIQRI